MESNCLVLNRLVPAVVSDADLPAATTTAVLAAVRIGLQALNGRILDATVDAERPAVEALVAAHRAFLNALFAFATDPRYVYCWRRHVDSVRRPLTRSRRLLFCIDAVSLPGRPAVVRTVLLAAALSTTTAPQLALAPAVQEAHVACLRAAMARPESDVRTVALQTVRSLLAQPPFAVRLVPDVAQLLLAGAAGDGAAAGPVSQEAIKVVAALVTTAPSDAARAAGMAVAVSVLVGVLARAESVAAVGDLRDAATKAIMQLGPAHPALFKEVVGQLAPADKGRLEAAIRAAAVAGGSNSRTRGESARPAVPSATAPAAPTIALTTSFANFG